MKKSFTLIELLIVIGIIMIFTALSLSIMVSIRKQRQVKVVAEQIKSRIMEAHSYAVAPRDLDRRNCGTNQPSLPLSYVQLEINNEVKELWITEFDTGNFPICNVGSPNITDILPSSTEFTNLGGSAQNIKINFSATGNNIGQVRSDSSPIPGSSILTFKIKNPSTLKTSTITVNQLTRSVTIN